MDKSATAHAAIHGSNPLERMWANYEYERDYGENAANDPRRPYNLPWRDYHDWDHGVSMADGSGPRFKPLTANEVLLPRSHRNPRGDDGLIYEILEGMLGENQH